ncbi:hypothetical protein [Bradyrhizobium sp. BR 10289]|uniref:hypothetical protein n=1 Tax=Bradyrhizobium sp. BR 10289 TaxID=2749993 RepID=UPI001C64CF21|nr:hypothetical protein [Bradyrhizobium sp. BR 10289]MBW7974483.1 hypothetical protein [Bradyrhizobium sp. BR 10289]
MALVLFEGSEVVNESGFDLAQVLCGRAGRKVLGELPAARQALFQYSFFPVLVHGTESNLIAWSQPRVD